MVPDPGGILVGLGVAAGSFTIVLSAFARNVTPQSRSLVFGIGTAAGSAGMFLFAPLTVAMIDQYGWHDTLVYFAVAMFVLPLLAIPLAGNAKTGRVDQGGIDQTLGSALREAFGKEPALIREGGSIPIVSQFRTILGVETLLLGLALPDCRAHSPNENFPLENLDAGIRINKAVLKEIDA